MYHGILIDQEFTDKSFPKSFKVFNKKQDGSWGVFGIEIEDSQLEDSIKKIQVNMRADKPWYAHLYNDNQLIVIFKNKVFRVESYISSWKPIIDYGKELKIPEEQLDFWPNRFQDERHYFS
ncbi:MAG: hypothetical protein US62_C0047G0010 [Candidatus Woesebacteria bacterium GW2011_GWA1_37_8]|uniref:Uncharacterized protein n=2 Tax=Candidatus Woeseibacteriota TaxID=1752722 RepID=A0A0G0PC73_9BACT|nr:MAG: hypothetical protein US39_C0012G0052 [Microgenomates group bacterium GW2011_GWC1_37_12b]KKQ43586.1 MAG: hypothetical protein US62_C0047G0010 [Candidatus Woesebacteria bacterium GW2011_GWA1_37_8]KKQ86881.1 MAG: hypothetical protein UT10_C0015G0022 [Candidatus Woesebacteria bacterium GW2011_GWB1_38_8b]